MQQATAVSCFRRIYQSVSHPLPCFHYMQAVQHLSGFDIADQDLFASLSMCLAAVGAPEQQLQDLRRVAAGVVGVLYPVPAALTVHMTW